MSIDSVQNSVVLAFDALDLGVSQTSSPIELREAVGFAAQVYWSAGVGTTGTIIIEATNDDVNSVSSPTYSQISSTAVAAGSGNLMDNEQRAMYSYIRVRFVRTAGAGGTITCKVSLKRN